MGEFVQCQHRRVLQQEDNKQACPTITGNVSLSCSHYFYTVNLVAEAQFPAIHPKSCILELM